MTNGDKIRKMPDEQLAMVIGRSCIHCVYQHEPDCTPYDCYSGKVEFLKKEVDEDGRQAD